MWSIDFLRSKLVCAALIEIRGHTALVINERIGLLPSQLDLASNRSPELSEIKHSESCKWHDFVPCNVTMILPVSGSAHLLTKRKVLIRHHTRPRRQV